jgi:hypothetical protein
LKEEWGQGQLSADFYALLFYQGVKNFHWICYITFMKTYHILVIAWLLIPTLSLAAFDKNLQYGSRGAEVRVLQEFLSKEGLYSGPITGNFYGVTKVTLISFQKREGLLGGLWWVCHFCI